jgi:hypothetical protein
MPGIISLTLHSRAVGGNCVTAKKLMHDNRSNMRIYTRRIILGAIFIISVFLLLIFINKQIQVNRFNKVVSEYLQINNYLEAKDLFERDLENNELKYFTYGMFYNKSYYRKLKRKYNLEIFHMGCIIEGRLSKYNFYIEENILKYEDKENIYFDRADSILTFFNEALDTKDYDYLILNASDSVIISNGLLNDSNKEKYEARYLFENYSDSLTSFNSSSTNSSYDDKDSLIYFFRKIDHLDSDKEPFNLRFCFVRKDNKYCFNELVVL